MDYTSLWESVINCLERREEIDASRMRTWLVPSKVVSLNEGELTLEVPNTFWKDWINKNYLRYIKLVLEEEYSIKADVRFVYDKSKSALKPGKREEAKDEPPASPKDFKYFKVDSRMRFENFVEGDSNNIAYAAATAIAKGSFGLYNPLFIYGNSGLGKTHLMNAIANQVGERFPELKIISLSGDDFLKDVVNQIAKGRADNDLVERMEQFSTVYGAADVWLMDDVQTLATREKCLDTFFNLFNSLFSRHKQIVLTSDEPPQKLNMPERFKSRFSAGLSVQISAPSFEERTAILIKSAGDIACPIEREAAMYVAEHLDAKDIRTLLGTLKQASLRASLKGTHITLDIAKEAVKGRSKNILRGMNPHELIGAVAASFKVSMSDIMSTKRDRGIVEPRQLAMYLMKRELNMPLTAIGGIFGKNHATVKHAVEKMEQDIKDTPHLEGIINKVLGR